MRRIGMIILIVALLTTLVSCQKKTGEIVSLESAELDNTSTDVDENVNSAGDTEYIFVYVCGAVNCEGVYELPNGSRIYQAIEVAGGFREDADTKAVNQAEVLEDEERIYVPVIGEEENESSPAEKGGKININKASKEELMSLPGVGESRAEDIIRYREEQGSFQNIEDIMRVSGIKEGLFEKIKDLITV